MCIHQAHMFHGNIHAPTTPMKQDFEVKTGGVKNTVILKYLQWGISKCDHVKFVPFRWKNLGHNFRMKIVPVLLL